jgi:hypothetical protein
MSRSRRVAIVLAVLALAAAAYGVFHLLYEKVERTEKTAPSGRAAIDPYYAAELLIEEYGFEVLADRGDPEDQWGADAIFWLAEERPDWDALWAQLEDGAIVVVDADHARVWYEEDPIPGDSDNALPGGIRFLTYDDAEGLLVVLPDAAMFATGQLELPGHVEALSEILEQLAPESAVVIVRRVARTHLLQLIFGRGLPAVLVLVVWLALLARRSALRFGPVLVPPEPGRRSFVEHLAAVGHFVRRHGGEEALVESARAEVLERFLRRSPELAGLSREALVDRLLEHVALDRETMERALVDSSRGHPRAFVDFVKALQELRKSP